MFKQLIFQKKNKKTISFTHRKERKKGDKIYSTHVRKCIGVNLIYDMILVKCILYGFLKN